MQFRKVQQISESHCGPAVLEMLMDAVGFQTSQSAIARAAGVNDRINEHGTRVDQLALATSRLAPHLAFWYKYRADITDIKYVLERGYAVAVEWQGVFYPTLEEQIRHGDNDAGHYSIISHYDEAEQRLVIVDPYQDFVNQDRIMKVTDFWGRWWDTNEVSDPETGRTRLETDEQLLFFITPEDEQFPFDQGFKQYISLDLD